VVVPANEAVPNPLLRQAREARNVTQDELSEGLVELGAKGVTGGLVSKWERGICRPNRFHRRLLCQYFDAGPRGVRVQGRRLARRLSGPLWKFVQGGYAAFL
jgi:transcriptional regulator with XRE-family HTH domain